MSAERAKTTFTFIDLIGLIAIVAVLSTLLLPAIADEQQASQRNQCMNKLKQLAIALQNHHDVFKKFPPTSYQGSVQGVASVWWPDPGTGAATGAIPSVGYTTDAGTKATTAGYSWIARILPYIDEAPVYNTISQASGKFRADAFTPFDVEGDERGVKTGQAFSVTFTSGGAVTRKHFAAIQFDELACPAFTGDFFVAPTVYKGPPSGMPPATYGRALRVKTLGSPPQNAAISNYVALAATHFPCMQFGPVEKLAATTQIPADAEAPNGMIVPGTGLNMKACTDGTSKTLMLCETIETAMNCWYDGTTTWTTGLNPNSLAKFPPSKADPTPWGFPNPQHFWLVPPGGTTALNVGPDPDRTVAYSPALEGYGAQPQVISWGPSSNHPKGIVMHVAVDAAARAIAPDIDPSLYMHLITRAGREPDAMPDQAN
ncbi:MAG TPA: DUF1559 domain-containing protein [Pirellulales bacterium]|nr:DUF1559 domain-containing protein [Pirellulales bacterium]